MRGAGRDALVQRDEAEGRDRAAASTVPLFRVGFCLDVRGECGVELVRVGVEDGWGAALGAPKVDEEAAENGRCHGPDETVLMRRRLVSALSI